MVVILKLQHTFCCTRTEANFKLSDSWTTAGDKQMAHIGRRSRCCKVSCKFECFFNPVCVLHPPTSIGNEILHLGVENTKRGEGGIILECQ